MSYGGSIPPGPPTGKNLYLNIWEFSSVQLEQLPLKQRVVRAKLTTPTSFSSQYAFSSVGRAAHFVRVV